MELEVVGAIVCLASEVVVGLSVVEGTIMRVVVAVRVVYVVATVGLTFVVVIAWKVAALGVVIGICVVIMYVSSYRINCFGLVTGGVGKRSRFLSATLVDIEQNNFYLISGISF